MACRPQIGQLDEKLAELEQERAELQEYQRHDRQRRSLEYTIYDKELTKIKAEMDKVVGGGWRCGGGGGGVGGGRCTSAARLQLRRVCRLSQGRAACSSLGHGEAVFQPRCPEGVLLAYR